MFKKKRFFLILLSTIVFLGSAYIPVSASTSQTIISGSVSTRSGTYYSTGTFPLDSNKLDYSFWRSTYGSYDTNIYLQVFKNSQWSTVAYASTSGSATRRGTFSNLESGLTYRILLDTNDPNSRTTSLVVSEIYD